MVSPAANEQISDASKLQMPWLYARREPKLQDEAQVAFSADASVS